uniref:Transmembrane protein n=1 Tax=Chromera velia CCMP2878 TaxID=1169474 RepID=A0A0G4ID34_9ALVE|eukprot:Cvel_113.t1-p1 / transcript=Cvel_113.t1 / gene=Cvel_113 / organism=Chromera_velia_CCMP2878 / gene_product=hypothetical protein / transcript_product=hypothetical protein / location=Cvel_scaffold8:177179-182058(-) / protein_length=730 / sequence_SO=supercontig / SO=protein_coding / is_pseudo=false
MPVDRIICGLSARQPAILTSTSVGDEGGENASVGTPRAPTRYTYKVNTDVLNLLLLVQQNRIRPIVLKTRKPSHSKVGDSFTVLPLSITLFFGQTLCCICLDPRMWGMDLNLQWLNEHYQTDVVSRFLLSWPVRLMTLTKEFLINPSGKQEPLSMTILKVMAVTLMLAFILKDCYDRATCWHMHRTLVRAEMQARTPPSWGRKFYLYFLSVFFFLGTLVQPYFLGIAGFSLIAQSTHLKDSIMDSVAIAFIVNMDDYVINFYFFLRGCELPRSAWKVAFPRPLLFHVEMVLALVFYPLVGTFLPPLLAVILQQRKLLSEDLKAVIGYSLKADHWTAIGRWTVLFGTFAGFALGLSVMTFRLLIERLYARDRERARERDRERRRARRSSRTSRGTSVASAHSIDTAVMRAALEERAEREEGERRDEQTEALARQIAGREEEEDEEKEGDEETGSPSHSRQISQAQSVATTGGPDPSRPPSSSPARRIGAKLGIRLTLFKFLVSLCCFVAMLCGLLSCLTGGLEGFLFWHVSALTTLTFFLFGVPSLVLMTVIGRIPIFIAWLEAAFLCLVALSALFPRAVGNLLFLYRTDRYFCNLTVQLRRQRTRVGLDDLLDDDQREDGRGRGNTHSLVLTEDSTGETDGMERGQKTRRSYKTTSRSNAGSVIDGIPDRSPSSRGSVLCWELRPGSSFEMNLDNYGETCMRPPDATTTGTDTAKFAWQQTFVTHAHACP